MKEKSFVKNTTRCLRLLQKYTVFETKTRNEKRLSYEGGLKTEINF